MTKSKGIILGAGMTGLTAGVASGFPIFETNQWPGGICSSYYMMPGQKDRVMPEGKNYDASAMQNSEAYRFEIGGGHWIFGGNSLIHRFMQSFLQTEIYTRASGVYFPESKVFVPYPLQNHLSYLGTEVAMNSLQEMAKAKESHCTSKTLYEWLESGFGKTLCTLFFHPFHKLYTAGLWDKVAPQDAYKSPVDLLLAIQGAFSSTPSVGYNALYRYPKAGLNILAQALASKSDVHYGKKAVKIDTHQKLVHFADGDIVPYNVIISTLPLNHILEMAGLSANCPADPYSSVLVVNIGAKKGHDCPCEQWLYIPSSQSGFHRVGFYSNVDPSFLPTSLRSSQGYVSLYVEKAYPSDRKPDRQEQDAIISQVIQELQEWNWIDEVQVSDPTWIDVAYTWSWPSSHWKTEAIRILEEKDIYSIGRYGRWNFQGIAESLQEGLTAGIALGSI